ncbi:MAG: hypothetical protein HKP58_16125 [Desulfatitalea sp.]|nr:type II secretion system F family protein [Desulfatitalea sp.]NNK01940.1 hypothetical protein [Desulfatitalea sp.]
MLRQLAMLSANGMSLAQAIPVLAQRNESRAIRRYCQKLRDDPHAIRQVENSVDPLMGEIIPGISLKLEKPEDLTSVLNELADIRETAGRYAACLRSALMYPLTVFSIMIIVVAILLIFVIPVFEEVFTDFGGRLPEPTMAVMHMSHWVRTYGILFILIVIAAMVTFSTYPSSQRLFLWLMPPLRKVIKDAMAIHFSHLLAALLKFDFSISESCRLAAQSVPSSAYAPRLCSVAMDVNDLSGLKEALKKNNDLPGISAGRHGFCGHTGGIGRHFSSFFRIHPQRL